jgi:hypothetical protein
MTTSTTRAVVLVLAVLAGAFVLSRGFGTGSAAAPLGTPKVGVSPTPTVSPKAKPTKTGKQLITGFSVQVLNGTSTSGLAGNVRDTLKGAGYHVSFIGNASSTPTTTIFYSTTTANAQQAAEYMKENFFASAEVKPNDATITTADDLTVVLGEDYAAQGGPSSSPTQ